MMNLRTKIFIYFLAAGTVNSCAQEVQGDKIQKSNTVAVDINFYDALKLRSDLNFERNKRILYTTIKDYEAFEIKYQNTNMQMDFVIRDRLHTAIYLNQEKNLLESMDGSRFDFPQNISASALTDEVVNLIGSMYYGSSEVRVLKND